MNPRFEERDAFKIVGVKKFFTTENGENFREIPKMWCECADQFEALLSLADGEPTGLLGVCADMYNNGFDYWIAVSASKPCPPQFSEREIPASTWAIFEATGPMPGAIQDVFRRVYAEWLPTSGYAHRDIPEIEWYSDGDMQSDTYKSEVWIPVVKR